MKKKEIVLCENCRSIMEPSKVSSENRKEIAEKLSSCLDTNKSQKKREFLVKVWKCSCPKRVYVIYLAE